MDQFENRHIVPARIYQDGHISLKRIVGILLAVVFITLLAACGIPSSTNFSESTPAPSPTVAATSRDVHNEPVKVDETYAMADVVSPTETPAATASPAPSPPAGPGRQEVGWHPP